MKCFFSYIGFCFLFATCSTSENNTGLQADTLANTNAIATSEGDTARKPEHLTGTWELVRMPGSANNWARTPNLHLNVDSSAFYGNTGCNNMSGRFVVRGASIIFDNEIITTKMACNGSYNEQVFLNNLLRVNNYSINDTALQLRQLDTIKLIFKRKPI